jgi:hypothetical protein
MVSGEGGRAVGFGQRGRDGRGPTAAGGVRGPTLKQGSRRADEWAPATVTDGGGLNLIRFQIQNGFKPSSDCFKL